MAGTMDPITIAALANFPTQLEAYYSVVPKAYKNWRPASWDGVPSEPFTPMEQVCHVKDIEIDGYHETLTARTGGMESASGIARRRSARPGALLIRLPIRRPSLHSFARPAPRQLNWSAKLTPQQLMRAAEFEGHRVTLRGLVHNLCSHDQQHLAGMQWLLARIAASMPEARI